MKLENTIVYIIGIPAVGKYTVAKEIARLTGAKLVDNQLINTPVFTVVGYDGKDSFPFPPGAWKEIEKIHRAVLRVIRDMCPREASFVFTNTLDAGEPGDLIWYRRIERVAKKRNAKFFPVWLTCDAAEIRRRKDSEDRKARLKDTDLGSIKRWTEEVEVLRVEHPNELTLDTTRLKPEEAATRILEHIKDRAAAG